MEGEVGTAITTNSPPRISPVASADNVAMAAGVGSAGVAAAAVGAAVGLARKTSIRKDNTPKPLDLTRPMPPLAAVPASPAGTEFSVHSVGPGQSPGPSDSAAAIAADGGPAQSAVHRVQLDFKPTLEDEMELRAGSLVRLLHEYDDGWVSVGPSVHTRKLSSVFTNIDRPSAFVLIGHNKALFPGLAFLLVLLNLGQPLALVVPARPSIPIGGQGTLPLTGRWLHKAHLTGALMAVPLIRDQDLPRVSGSHPPAVSQWGHMEGVQHHPAPGR
jgi:hypothetical protein